jgi:hypothetical protein
MAAHRKLDRRRVYLCAVDIVVDEFPIDVWERLRAQVLAKKGAAPISECGFVEIPLPSLAVLCYDIPCRAGSLYNTTT